MSRITVNFSLAARRRRRIATGLERVVTDSERDRWSSAVPFDQLAVQEARRELAELASLLRKQGDAAREAVDVAQWILTHPASPLYDGRRGHGLREAARRAASALG